MKNHIRLGLITLAMTVPIAACKASNTNEANKMSVVSCWQAQDRMVASAFMLPPGWSSTCQAKYDQNAYGIIFFSSIIDARSKDGRMTLNSWPSQLFKSDQGMIQIPLNAIQQEKMSFGRVDPRTTQWYQETLQNNPKPVDLKQFVQQKLAPEIKRNGLKISRIEADPMAVQLRARLSKKFDRKLPDSIKINVISVYTDSTTEPNKVGLLKIVQAISYGNPVTEWSLDFYVADGERDQVQEVSEVINLVISTLEPAPVFEYGLARLNIKLSKQRMAAGREIAKRANIIHNALNEVNDGMMKSYQSRSSSQERTHRKNIDATREVETYTNPFDGTTVKAPSSNEHFYTNNLGDFIGSNNPLFNPNDSLTTLYNWTKLEKAGN